MQFVIRRGDGIAIFLCSYLMVYYKERAQLDIFYFSSRSYIEVVLQLHAHLLSPSSRFRLDSSFFHCLGSRFEVLREKRKRFPLNGWDCVCILEGSCLGVCNCQKEGTGQVYCHSDQVWEGLKFSPNIDREICINLLFWELFFREYSINLIGLLLVGTTFLLAQVVDNGRPSCRVCILLNFLNLFVLFNCE